MFLQLETDNLILRKARLEDCNLIWKNVWSDKSIADNMLWEVTKTLEEAQIRIKKTINYQSTKYAYFVCLKQTNEPIGFAGVYEKDKDIYEETGICISKRFQGLGYGKEVVTALKDLVFSKLNGEKFIYGCFSTNNISKKLCLSCGFKYLESEPSIREHDKMEYISDYYFFDKEMYVEEQNKIHKFYK